MDFKELNIVEILTKKKEFNVSNIIFNKICKELKTELRDAKKAIEILGGEIEKIETITLENTDIQKLTLIDIATIE